MIEVLEGLAVFSIFGVSRYYYQNDPRSYRYRKVHNLARWPWMSWFYQFIRWSTLLVCVGTLVGSWTLVSYQWQLYTPTGSMRLLGYGLAISGLAVFVAGMRHLGEHYSPCFDSYLPAGITVSGIYEVIRHPIYVGNLTLLSGLFLVTASPIILFNVLGLTCCCVWSARLEEANLAAAFPAYEAYRQRTGGFLPVVIRLGGWR